MSDCRFCCCSSYYFRLRGGQTGSRSEVRQTAETETTFQDAGDGYLKNDWREIRVEYRGAVLRLPKTGDFPGAQPISFGKFIGIEKTARGARSGCFAERL